MSLHMLGAVGANQVDLNQVFQTAGGLASGIQQQVEGARAAKEATASEKAALERVLAADRVAVEARVAASMVPAADAVRRQALETAAAVAEAAQDRVAAKLPPSVFEARASAAEEALAAAGQALQAKPDAHNAAVVEAWTKVVNKAQSAKIVSLAPGVTAERSTWFTRRVVGPVPGWGVLVGGAGILAVIALVLKKVLARGIG